jgi:hypothetical protein
MHAAHSPVDHYRLRGGRMSSREMIPEDGNNGAFRSNGLVEGESPLLLAVTTSRWFITQELWRIPAEQICSFQAAILQERFHRFFRGRDSMRGNKENRR